MATLLLYLYLAAVVTIKVLPQTMMVNAPIRITCYVPHRAENRKLIIAVEGYRESEYALDGEAAPAIFQKVYERVPCDTTAVSCTVIEDTGKTSRAALPVYVGGCD